MRALKSSTISQFKGYTPFLMFRYLSLTYLDFGDSLILNGIRATCAASEPRRPDSECH
jgi:hypothetical protein